MGPRHAAKRPRVRRLTAARPAVSKRRTARRAQLVWTSLIVPSMRKTVPSPLRLNPTPELGDDVARFHGSIIAARESVTRRL